jgi:CBS domain-containing protein
MRVEDLLQAKGTRVVTSRPDTRLSTVAHLLKVEHVGAVVVSEDGARVLGILSERDIVHGLVAHGADVLDKHAADLMTREVTTCRRSDDLKRVMALMTRQRVRHLPVVEAGVLEGLISIGDVVKKRLEETETEAAVMRDMAAAHA